MVLDEKARMGIMLLVRRGWRDGEQKRLECWGLVGKGGVVTEDAVTLQKVPGRLLVPPGDGPASLT